LRFFLAEGQGGNAKARRRESGGGAKTGSQKRE
jgi:hypothetical protein